MLIREKSGRTIVNLGGYANRGMSLEKDINSTNAYYKAAKLAVFNKRPTPIKVLRTGNKRIESAIFEAPSTLDYYGAYKGKYFDFEAKETQIKTSFPLKNIHEHQVQHMKEVMEYGGAHSFLICRFTKLGKTFFLDAKHVLECWDNMLAGGRKSISIDYFQKYGYEIPSTYSAFVHYLPIIEKVYF